MNRGWLGLAFLASMVLGGCAHTPQPQMQAFYHSPSNAYTLNLSSTALQGHISMSEQCEPYGGSLNLWDSKNRFFRVDYLNFIEHPSVRAPSFANDRTLNELVINYYQNEVITKQKSIRSNKVLFRDTVNSTVGEGLLTIMSLEMYKEAVPPDALDNTVYYGFFIFRRGDYAYIVQHRQEIYQPERMKAMLVTLAQDMTIPGAKAYAPQIGNLSVVDQVFGSQQEINAWKKAMKCDSKGN
ncbi:hypothetical protein [Agitococcus lubricus]|uniref:Lipoprotein n=1 Tax=Agitococcus lubricus TaxID=1077255 RepID=A0A2T5J037_9GAMM|nr:hypothetical protein [Agitococcus lubricus]PTQ89694.1 hypothetical protein C8N29_10517 [Agitococcus lubricus]